VSFLTVVGVVLLVVAAVLYWIRRGQEARLHAIAGTETSTAQGLADLAKGVRDELGGEPSFRGVAEVTGLVRCDSPLTSDAAKQPCVYYTTTVTREYEETYWDWEGTDQNRHQVQRTRRASQTVASNAQQTDFSVEDATGRVRVHPDRARFDALKVVDRFDPAPPPDLGSLIGQVLGGAGRTIGYHTTESLIPIDRRAYVLGEAVDSADGLTIQAPGERGKQFIISTRSEEELIGSARSAAQWLLVGAAACGAIGALLVVLSLVGPLG
jgi:E3 Ubiquitin ligase